MKGGTGNEYYENIYWARIHTEEQNITKTNAGFGESNRRNALPGAQIECVRW